MTDQSGATPDRGDLITRLPKYFAELETLIGEARDEGYLEGQADCAGAHAELWNKVIRWAESRDLLGEPDEQSGGYTSEQLFDAIVSHENELDQALIKAGERIAELERRASNAEAHESRIREQVAKVSAAWSAAEARVKTLEIAAVKAVIPLEALRLLGPKGVSDELWTGIVEGSDAVRAALSQSGEG